MPYDETAVLVAVGPDRVGLVEKISEFITYRGANIEDSRMAVFAGEFALILLLSGTPQQLVEISGSYNDLSIATGLNIWLKPGRKRSAAESGSGYLLTASSLDHPGIVHAISKLLSRHGANIESMETKTYQAPETGTPMFRMEAVIGLPAGANIEKMKQEFRQLEKELSIDLRLADPAEAEVPVSAY